MVGNLSEVTQQGRDSGPQSNLLPGCSSPQLHAHALHPAKKQADPLPFGVWRMETLPPRSQRSPGSWPADSLLSRGAWPSVVPVLVLQRPQSHGICREAGCSAASQAGVISTRVAQGNAGAGAPRAVGPAAHACCRVDGCAPWRIERALPPRKTSAELGCLFLPYFVLTSLFLWFSLFPQSLQ